MVFWDFFSVPKVKVKKHHGMDYWQEMSLRAEKKIKHYEKRVKEYSKKDKNKIKLKHYKKKLEKWQKKRKYREKHWNQASHRYKMQYGG